VAVAQSVTSGDIAGTVTDVKGAALPGAQVTVKSLDTGESHTATSGGHGEYRFSLLKPGHYQLKITAPNFETSELDVDVQVGMISSGDAKLSLGKSTQVVEVTAAQPLLDTETADIQTSFTMKQVQNLPNPGNDLTFVAQTAPGSVMNTTTPTNGSAFGYGNFSSFGLPATSNTFTVNGGYENDPFLNLNNSGATNLLLGQNDIGSVDVISNAYSAQYGGLGASQVNEISRSGGNAYHGNATYYWNGRTMNANDYFLNQTDTPRTFDNVNQFSAAAGGPIKKDKAFWFANYEGLRVVIPTSGHVGVPTPAYQTATLAALAADGNAAEIPLYNNIFSYYNSAAHLASAAPDPLDPNDNLVPYSITNFTHEFLFTGRTDFNLGANDKMFIHGEWDKGLQATYTDPINSLFNADSPQPQYSGQLSETHNFNANLTNQFVFATIYYRAIFTNTQLAAATDVATGGIPFTGAFAASDFGLVGGLDYIWPQGRNVTNYQVIDDLSWVRGNHTIKVGYDIRRDDVTDYSPSVTTTPLEVSFESSFQAGTGDEFAQNFPSRLTQPVALYNEGFYIQDSWKALPNLTVTAGMRFEHNSNPTCLTSCFARLTGDFATSNPSTLTPYNQEISSGLHAAFNDFQKIGYEPRIGFAWSPFGAGTKTVVRGGFGIFNDAFPATVADAVLNNAPTNVGFTLFSPNFGGSTIFTLDPSQANSGFAIAAASNAAFIAAYAAGGSNSSIGLSVPGFASPNFSNPSPKLQYPTYEEYSLEVQQQVNRTTAVDISYVGNHGYHEPVFNNGVNANGLFSLPANTPNPNFAEVTEIYAGAVSNYNGLIASVIHHSGPLSLQFNYQWTHALDEISNGGVLPFSAGASILSPLNPNNLSDNYGNADYDTHQYVSGSYVYDMPYYGGPRVLTGGWELSGTLFHNTGYPFSVVDGALHANNSGITVLAQQTSFQNFSCGGTDHTINFNAAGGGNHSQCSFINAFTGPTNFGQQERNQVFGPGYFDTDLSVQKGFKVPGMETGNLKLGAQFFNILNHPNFATPVHDTSSGEFGFITSTVNTPTSILGSGLGGNASPRLIQLKGTFEF